MNAKAVLVAPGAGGIIEAADDAALVVLGLSGRWAQEGLGAARVTVAREARSPVVLVRRGVRPGGLAPTRGAHAVHLVGGLSTAHRTQSWSSRAPHAGLYS